MINESMSHETLPTRTKTLQRWSPNSKLLCHIRSNISCLTQFGFITRTLNRGSSRECAISQLWRKTRAKVQSMTTLNQSKDYSIITHCLGEMRTALSRAECMYRSSEIFHASGLRFPCPLGETLPLCLAEKPRPRPGGFYELW